MAAERTTFLRALAAFLALPTVVAGLIPAWIVAASGGPTPGFGVAKVIGCVVLAVGLVILLRCVRDFYVAGRGTLAPSDPPRSLVTVGLYRYMRNPMDVGVITIIAGIALTFGSPVVGWYAAFLLLAFHVRVVLNEERWLARTYPTDWQRYSANVRRWWPRITPWE